MLAETLYLYQPSVAKMERGTDIYLSTLRSHIEAMGGELEVLAKFPNGVVKINNFAELAQVLCATIRAQKKWTLKKLQRLSKHTLASHCPIYVRHLLKRKPE